MPRIDISFGIQERGDNNDNKPWLGFCYGSWYPVFHSNGQRFKPGGVTDIGMYWLCFHVSLTWWRNK